MTELELRAQIDELFLLQRVAQRISSLLDIDVLLEEIVGDVAQTFASSPRLVHRPPRSHRFVAGMPSKRPSPPPCPRPQR
jgi:hypothetical protein